ncbi:MAG: hypothetical protein WA001_02560 [Patescibacteria group bacterium]
MTLNSTLDILYLVLAVVILWVGVLTCWALYEVAKMLHQANLLVTEAREKIGRIEQGVTRIKEKVESSLGFLSILGGGGKSLMSFLHAKEEKQERRRSSKKRKNEDEDEE